MNLAGIQKLTLLDFPGHTAATVFTPGCNFRCPFCHNADLVVGSQSDLPAYATSDFFAFLDKRKGLLDGVCITGGEPLLQPDIAEFCERIKHAGFAVKLDTNGSFPERLRELVEGGLVDAVAMDVKNCPARYAETVGVPSLDLAPIQASIDFLREGTVPFEFRTTVMQELHTAADLMDLAAWIQGAPAWYLQNFADSERVLGGEGRFHPWSTEDLHAVLPALQQHVPTASLRGTD